MKQIIPHLAKKLSLSEKYTSEIVDIAVSVIRQRLLLGETILVDDIASFSSEKKPEQVLIYPARLTKVLIPPCLSLRITFGCRKPDSNTHTHTRVRNLKTLISIQANLDEHFAQLVSELLIKEIVESLQTNPTCKIIGFGAFKKVSRPKFSFNPKSRPVGKRTRIIFVPEKSFQNELNKDFSCFAPVIIPIKKLPEKKQTVSKDIFKDLEKMVETIQTFPKRPETGQSYPEKIETIPELPKEKTKDLRFVENKNETPTPSPVLPEKNRFASRDILKDLERMIEVNKSDAHSEEERDFHAIIASLGMDSAYEHNDNTKETIPFDFNSTDFMSTVHSNDSEKPSNEKKEDVRESDFAENETGRNESTKKYRPYVLDDVQENDSKAKNKKKQQLILLLIGLLIVIIVGAVVFKYVSKPDKEVEEVIPSWNVQNTPGDSKPAIDEPNDKFLAIELVKAGDDLPTLSRKYYGSSVFWVYLYDANKELIPDPRHLRPGIRLTIPNPDVYGFDLRSEEAVDLAKKKGDEILNKQIIK